MFRTAGSKTAIAAPAAAMHAITIPVTCSARTGPAADRATVAYS